MSEYFTVIPGKPKRHDSKPVVPESGSAGDANFRERDWSSSAVADNDDYAWGVYFYGGYFYYYGYYDGYNDYARCVRSSVDREDW